MDIQTKLKYDLVYCIGDSQTWGADQADDLNKDITLLNRFSTLIGEYYQLPVLNKGVPGSGNEYVMKTLYTDMREYRRTGVNPLVFCSYTDAMRKELYCANATPPGLHTIGPNTYFSEEFLKEYFVNHFDWDSIKLDSAKLVDSSKILMKYLGISFVDVYSNEILTGYDFITTEEQMETSLMNYAGPEGMFNGEGHLNIIGHRKVADWLIAKCNQLYFK